MGYIRAPMDASQIDGPAAERSAEPLVRSLGAWGLALLVVNGVIGAGIFGLPGKAAAEAGTASPLVFLVCGALLVPVVLSFAQVSSLFRGSGGPMLYAKEAFGPATGFLTGWAFYVTRVSASAANLGLMVTSLGFVSSALADGVIRQVVLFGLCAAMVVINCVGTRRAIRAVGALTLLKAVPLLALVAVGLWQQPGCLLVDPVLPEGGDFGAAVVLVVYAYVGWETGLVPAGEAQNPSRDMPRALVLGLLGFEDPPRPAAQDALVACRERLPADVGDVEVIVLLAGRASMFQPIADAVYQHIPGRVVHLTQDWVAKTYGETGTIDPNAGLKTLTANGGGLFALNQTHADTSHLLLNFRTDVLDCDTYLDIGTTQPYWLTQSLGLRVGHRMPAVPGATAPLPDGMPPVPEGQAMIGEIRLQVEGLPQDRSWEPWVTIARGVLTRSDGQRARSTAALALNTVDGGFLLDGLSNGAVVELENLLPRLELLGEE